MNYATREPRPLGGLSKPGAGQVMVTMAVRPPGAVPLMVDLVSSARNAATVAIGDGATNLGMIYEYNYIAQQYAGVIARGEVTPAIAAEFQSRRTSLLASIMDLVRGAWIDLRDFTLDAYAAVSDQFAIFVSAANAAADAIRASEPPERIAAREAERDSAHAILQYYLDTITALGPQILQITKDLDIAGQLSIEKVRAFKADFKAANTTLFGFIQNMVTKGVEAADQAADALAKIAKELAKTQKWMVVGLVGIAVVAVVGAAIYFIPRPRRR